METLVKTNLTIGSTRQYQFGEDERDYIVMHNNPGFEKKYDGLESFLKDFYPNTPSRNLMNRIKEEFNSESGQITFKPRNYKANQTFYFERVS